MPRRITPAKRAEIVRLRVERQLSAPAIARRVGVSNHTVYKLLRKHPWTGRAVKVTDWTPAEIGAVIRLWPRAAVAEIKAALPRRRLTSISRKASELGVRRPSAAYRRDGAKAHPLIVKLEQTRRLRGYRRTSVSKRSGVHVNQLLKWSLGRAMPRLDKFCDWAAALGCDVVVRRRR